MSFLQPEAAVSVIQIVFPKPCHEDWDAMLVEERSRFCAACGKAVHDLAAYTPEEAETLLTGADGVACVRATVTPDGQVATRPSAAGRRLTAAILTPALAALLAATPAAAQPTRGAIAGVVKMQDGAAVRVTALAPGVRRSTQTDSLGQYALTGLAPGTYRIVFSKHGMRPWAGGVATVAAASTAVVDGYDPRLPPPVPKGPIGEAIIPPAPVPLAGAPLPPVHTPVLMGITAPPSKPAAEGAITPAPPAPPS